MSEHLDDLTWERLAMAELPAAERATTLRHVTSCKECAAIYKAVLALETRVRTAGLEGPPAVIAAPDEPVDEPAGAAPAPAPGTGRAARRRWRWAAAGTALAAAAALLVWARLRATDPDVDPGIRRGAGHTTVELVAPHGTPPSLAWRPFAGAARYRVSVFTDDGRRVFAREVDAPPLVWPAEVPAAPGAYRWKVEALGDAGVIAGSSLQAFRIPP